MTDRLFAYGTLRFPAILQAVTGLKLRPVAAKLDGYRCEGVRGEVYPAVVADSAAQVRGALYQGLNRAAIAALDVFEGAPYCRRVVSVVRDDGRTQAAYCYVFPPAWRNCLDGSRWDPQHFEYLHLAAYLRRLRR